MTKSPWFWLGLLLVLVVLVWLWHRLHKKPRVVVVPGVGTPLQSPAAAPPPTNIFSTLAGDAKAASGIFSGASSIFSSIDGSS
jgi:hypothetical protein